MFAQWKTISSSLACCGQTPGPEDSRTSPQSGSQSVHQPLYPPGRIIHIVRHHHQPRRTGEVAAYQGVWADNKDFDSVLISKRMLQDHMPDNVLDALEKVSMIMIVMTFQLESALFFNKSTSLPIFL